MDSTSPPTIPLPSGPSERKRHRTEDGEFESLPGTPPLDGVYDLLLALQRTVAAQAVELNHLKEENKRITSQLETLSHPLPQCVHAPLPLPVNPPVQASQSPPNEGVDLPRSLVFAHVPESQDEDPSIRVKEDYESVVQILSLVGAPALPLSVYRMPIDDEKYTPGQNRLLKVVLPTSGHQKLTLRRAHRLSQPHIPYKYCDTFIRPSFANYSDRPRVPPRRSLSHANRFPYSPSASPAPLLSIPFPRYPPYSYRYNGYSTQDARQPYYSGSQHNRHVPYSGNR